MVEIQMHTLDRHPQIIILRSLRITLKKGLTGSASSLQRHYLIQMLLKEKFMQWTVKIKKTSKVTVTDFISCRSLHATQHIHFTNLVLEICRLFITYHCKKLLISALNYWNFTKHIIQPHAWLWLFLAKSLLIHWSSGCAASLVTLETMGENRSFK